MYLITNRVLTKAKNLKALGKTPSPKGPNELRLVKIKKSGNSWRVNPVTDSLSKNNENDSALRAPRIKPGDEQKARLGHYTRKLNSSNAYYLDVTAADHVGSEHSYFKGKAVHKNKKLEELFRLMLSGDSVENLLQYHPDSNTYKF